MIHWSISFPLSIRTASLSNTHSCCNSIWQSYQFPVSGGGFPIWSQAKRPFTEPPATLPLAAHLLSQHFPSLPCPPHPVPSGPSSSCPHSLRVPGTSRSPRLLCGIVAMVPSQNKGMCCGCVPSCAQVSGDTIGDTLSTIVKLHSSFDFGSLDLLSPKKVSVFPLSGAGGLLSFGCMPCLRVRL